MTKIEELKGKVADLATTFSDSLDALGKAVDDELTAIAAKLGNIPAGTSDAAIDEVITQVGNAKTAMASKVSVITDEVNAEIAALTDAPPPPPSGAPTA